MTETEAIWERHSVRSYLSKPIDPETVQQLCDQIEVCNRESGLHLQFLADAGGTFKSVFGKASGLATAPSAIACIGPDTEDLDERVGYYGEKIVLFAQQIGLNTCWVGMVKAKHVPVEIAAGERLSLAIAIGYGANQGSPRKSKTFEQVASAQGDMPQWFRNGVELALLAPTAMNQQKFAFHLNADGTVTASDQKGPFSKVDLGIVKYHFDVARRSTEK